MTLLRIAGIASLGLPAIAATHFHSVPPASPSKPVAAYHGTVERIIQAKCQPCHHAGGVAPFSLSSYADAKGHAKTINEVVQKGLMPPWFAAPESPSPWKNDRSLSADEKKAVQDWVASGAPQGDPKAALPPKKYESTWQIGKPDAVFQLPTPIKVKADGIMPYENVLVPVGMAEDRWIQAMEVKPTAKQVVHHVLVFVVPKGANREQLRGEGSALAGFFAAYVPGNSTLHYPDGFAKRIPAGSDLRFQIHYTPNGKAVEDQTQIGLLFSKKPVEHEVRTAGIFNIFLNIPPGADNHREVARLDVPADVKLMSFLPHMHVRGKACRYELVNADGKRETLLDIPRYDFNWQLAYDYANPMPIEKGSRIEFSAWFDNSSKNPANPDPSKNVRWGDQTYDEMHLGYVEYYVPGAKPGDDSTGLSRRGGRLGAGAGAGINPNQIGLIFRRLDRNSDGKVTEEEAGALWERVKLADADGDGKITLQEARKAFGG